MTDARRKLVFHVARFHGIDARPFDDPAEWDLCESVYLPFDALALARLEELAARIPDEAPAPRGSDGT